MIDCGRGSPSAFVDAGLDFTRLEDGEFHRETTIHPELPDPGTADLVNNILAGFAYHLNVMPLDAWMPDAGSLVRAHEIAIPDAPHRASAGSPPRATTDCVERCPA